MTETLSWKKLTLTLRTLKKMCDKKNLRDLQVFKVLFTVSSCILSTDFLYSVDSYSNSDNLYLLWFGSYPSKCQSQLKLSHEISLSCLSGWTDVNCCVQTPTLFSFRPYIWWLGIQYRCHINKTYVMQMVLLFNIRNQLYSKQTFVRWLI